ncbi:hypothetical protein Mapa_005354 [Marchantia paleacea]|nr:hypothetical protein Mapa_005354 [Marchantia paleacea]
MVHVSRCHIDILTQREGLPPLFLYSSLLYSCRYSSSIPVKLELTSIRRCTDQHA